MDKNKGNFPPLMSRDFRDYGAMSEIHSLASDNLPNIPDDLTLPQFILDSQHLVRPIRKDGIPWFVDDGTGKKIGFEELRARTFGLANALSFKYNLKENDVALIFSPNHIDYPVAIWAVHRLGAIVSGANPTYTTEELIYQLEATNAAIIITHPESLSIAQTAAAKVGIPADHIILFDSLPGVVHPNVCSLIAEGLRREPHFVERKLNPGESKTKVAFLSFSSGTTGKPKAVQIPHRSPIANIIQLAVHNRVNETFGSEEDGRYRPGDVAIAVLPFYHIYGLVVNLHFLLFCGMSLVVVPKFNFTNFLRSIVKHRITHLLLVPPQVVLLCKHPAVKNYDLNHVRFVMVGAAPLSPELHNQLIALFPNAHLGQAFGLTETCTALAHWSINEKRGRIGSAGQLLAGVTVRIVKPDGTLCSYGEPGELVVKSPANSLGYLNNPQATKDTFKDGWVYTGDEVIVDKDTEMFVVDRLKEILKVRGYQVAPADLEGCLFDHPDVADSCVVGIPDDYSGEIPMAFIVLNPDAAKRVQQDNSEADRMKASIIQFVADRRVKYKHLAGGIEFIDAIPKNPSGKLLRRVLRDRAKELRAKPRAKL